MFFDLRVNTGESGSPFLRLPRLPDVLVALCNSGFLMGSNDCAVLAQEEYGTTVKELYESSLKEDELNQYNFVIILENLIVLGKLYPEYIVCLSEEVSLYFKGFVEPFIIAGKEWVGPFSNALAGEINEQDE